MSDFFEALVDTAERANIKIISDELCCKLLAWLLVFSGQYEVPYNQKLIQDLQITQRRLNIFGGEIPNKELVPELQKRVKELNDRQADWLQDLKKRYNLTVYAIKND